MRRRRKKGNQISKVLCVVLVGVIAGIALRCANVSSKALQGAAARFFSVIKTSGVEYRANSSQAETEGGKAEMVWEAAGSDDWRLILVNQSHYIPDDYEVELVELSNGQCVDKRIYPALQEMFDAARAEGVYPIVASGYRTAEKQQSIMDEKIEEYIAEGYSEKTAKSKAEIWVAVPGTSEHQLGISVDINADGIHSTGNQVYDWLDQNGHKFGFIKRYPEDKTEITGIINEPWHYRYVGAEAAAEMYRSGVCLEEYLGEKACEINK